MSPLFMGVETQGKSMETTRPSPEAPSSPDGGPNLGLCGKEDGDFPAGSNHLYYYLVVMY